MEDTSEHELLQEVRLVEVVQAGNKSTRISSLLSRLRKRLRGGRRAQREEFACILDVTRNAAMQDPLVLPSLIKLIGRVAQARAMSEVLRHPQDDTDCEYDPQIILFDLMAPLTPDGLSLYQLRREVQFRRSLKLGVDVILPWPWNRDGLIRNLSGLRFGGEWGKWRQDWNHCIELWLPLGIGWVIGGNHSLTAGILQATGKVKPEVTYDISDVYDYVICDGVNYMRSSDCLVISPVTDLEVAAMFEIG